MRGSCDGGEGYRVYEFTAPDTATYIFSVEGHRLLLYSQRPSISARSVVCPILVVSSGDFARGPSVRLEMEAGELVYVFVDGQSNLNFDITGTFRLDVNEHTPPDHRSLGVVQPIREQRPSR